MIDDAIVIVILGMDQEGITTISGLVTTDEEDEGVGELTFLGHQEEGVITELRGLNMFFAGDGSGLTLKAGGSIFVDVTRPFMVYNYSFETGEYEFPVEGGQLAYDFGTEVIEGVQIFADAPKADYVVSTPEGEDVPEWLTIELEDMFYTEGEYAGQFNGVVNAHVTAAPNTGADREATVRFAINGAYLDYHFIQKGNGTGPQPAIPGDLDGNNVVDVEDVNAAINIALKIKTVDDYPGSGDMNGDGIVDVEDVNLIINKALGL